MANFVSQFALRALNASDTLPVFSRALENALETNPPPYGESWFGEKYRFMVRNPSWFASLLVSDVDLEGYSAKQLWAYANTVSHIEFAKGLQKHAIDEARHSRMFANLLFTVFPKLKTEELCWKLNEMSPRLKISEATFGATDAAERPFEELLNSAILISLHEIKALILEQFLCPTLTAYSPLAQHRKIAILTNQLISDEIQHIRYSAEFIEAAALKHHEYIFEAVADFQRVINSVTLDEIEKMPEPQMNFEISVRKSGIV